MLPIAVIREDECIGCTKCIQACPVDCIIGSENLMHTVVANECIGCKLCIPVCPVDCIDLTDPDKNLAPVNKALTKARVKAKKLRESTIGQSTTTDEKTQESQTKKDYIKNILNRTRQKKQN